MLSILAFIVALAMLTVVFFASMVTLLVIFLLDNHAVKHNQPFIVNARARTVILIVMFGLIVYFGLTALSASTGETSGGIFGI